MAITPGVSSALTVRLPNGVYSDAYESMSVSGTVLTVGGNTYDAGSVIAAHQLLDQIEAAVSQGWPFVALKTMNDASVTSLDVAAGIASGGTTVTLTGTGFRPGCKVFFGPTACTDVAVVNETTIVVHTPAFPGGVLPVVVDVRYSDDRGEGGGLILGYTYPAPSSPTPAVPPGLSITPTTAAYAPATDYTFTFTITGGAFFAGCIVQLIDAVGMVFNCVATVDTSTQITFILPAANIPTPPDGASDVRYTGPDGSVYTLTGGVTWS